MFKWLSKEFQNMLKFWLVDQESHKGADKLDGSSQNPTCNSIIISHPNIYYYYISFSYDQPTVVSQVGGLGQIVALLSSLKALNETNFQTKIKTIKLHLLDMNPYLAMHVGIVDAPSDIWHEAHVHHTVGFVQHEAFTGWNPIFFCWRVTFVSPLSNAKHCLPPPIPLPQKTLSHCLLLPLSPL